MLLRKPKLRRIQQSRHTNTSGAFAAQLLNHDAPLMLGGLGVVVHIDSGQPGRLVFYGLIQ